ncbi:hypothetical protein [Paracoccus sp. IB05]|uniref:hypothetical protein n=1 Tax=Paracoccus sp. IB05 TaxID=2779367 RepID=UPI0018E7784D|nr:hypothetical protein [Paracoccus sp. IB05]MBJ2149896.1 hypothetical protein [Paracoccus sp. IB05]
MSRRIASGIRAVTGGTCLGWGTACPLLPLLLLLLLRRRLAGCSAAADVLREAVLPVEPMSAEDLVRRFAAAFAASC